MSDENNAKMIAKKNKVRAMFILETLRQMEKNNPGNYSFIFKEFICIMV